MERRRFAFIGTAFEARAQSVPRPGWPDASDVQAERIGQAGSGGMCRLIATASLLPGQFNQSIDRRARGRVEVAAQPSAEADTTPFAYEGPFAKQRPLDGQRIKAAFVARGIDTAHVEVCGEEVELIHVGSFRVIVARGAGR